MLCKICGLRSGLWRTAVQCLDCGPLHSDCPPPPPTTRLSELPWIRLSVVWSGLLRWLALFGLKMPSQSGGYFTVPLLPCKRFYMLGHRIPIVPWTIIVKSEWAVVSCLECLWYFCGFHEDACKWIRRRIVLLIWNITKAVWVSNMAVIQILSNIQFVEVLD